MVQVVYGRECGVFDNVWAVRGVMCIAYCKMNWGFVFAPEDAGI